jgi:Ca-activated chloride channel family protein
MRKEKKHDKRKGFPMRRFVAVLILALAAAGPASAAGILIPVEKKVPPLAMLNHQVTVSIDEQVAVTKIEQTFRNHTDRQLEATYVFPVPKGASVRKFTMWVDGKEVPGELVEADKARKIYTDIVYRTQDPGLLEYMGNNLLKLRVFPVPPKGDQKISISYTSVANNESGLIEYVYPLKTDGKAVSTLEKFSLNLTLRSQHLLQNIYSPSHAITITRPNDRQANVTFEKDQAVLDKDFQLFYTAGGKDVGLTTIAHRPSPGQNGYFMFLISPRAELSKSQQAPRDFVFVLDTSGSMRGKRMDQAKNALKYCLKNLTDKDRFTIVNFATTVNHYANQLLTGDADETDKARRWVDMLEPTGGTAINDALTAALELRPKTDDGRTFTIVFFTDGRPTIGETNPDKILKTALTKNTANTRIFTFGVGDDVNATMLDRLAEESRAISSYVRESEDIEAKVSSLYGKISNPVLTNLKLTVGDTVKLSEVYPPVLPDLFHGTQLVVLGRYTGTGHAAVKLTGMVGKDSKEFVYEVSFVDKTNEDKTFVEDLWARRKVGYLLDQIRANGEKKELVDEVITLAKRYGITTPYTSYLIVPDMAVPVAGRGAKGHADRPNVSFGAGAFGGGDVQSRDGTSNAAVPPGLPRAPNGKAAPVSDFIKKVTAEPGGAASSRAKVAGEEIAALPNDAHGRDKDNKYLYSLQMAKSQFEAYRRAERELKDGQLRRVQEGGLGVELSVNAQNLRNQSQLGNCAQRWIGGRNCLDVGGVWIDEAYDPKMKVVTCKAMSKAYFRILERQPSVRRVFQIGNHLVWVTPSGTALVIDAGHGQEEMTDADIDRLFVAVPTKKS